MNTLTISGHGIGVYLPVSSHNIEEFNEYLDYLWALYESLSTEGLVITLGDLNGDLGNSLGERGRYDPNERGLKLAEFANYFNLCTVNLLDTCSGPLETYVSHCGRYISTLDYIFLPNCLSNNIVSCRTFDKSINNTPDHLPTKLELNYSTGSNISVYNNNCSRPTVKNRIKWSSLSNEEIQKSFTIPIANELLSMCSSDYN